LIERIAKLNLIA